MRDNIISALAGKLLGKGNRSGDGSGHRDKEVVTAGRKETAPDAPHPNPVNGHQRSVSDRCVNASAFWLQHRSRVHPGGAAFLGAWHRAT